MNSVVNKTVLPSGIRVVTEFMPHVRSVSIGAWLNNGSRDECSENNGISHFLEHMNFKGTSNRNTAEIAESLESVGGTLNAFTSKEFTCYYAIVLDEHSELAVDVVMDLLSSPIIDEGDIEKEKKVVLEEISSLDDTPDELIHDYFHKNLFRDHPLSFSVLGTKKNINSLNKDAIVEFRTAHYTTDSLVVTAAGNVDHDSLCSFVNKYANIPHGNRVARNNNGYIKPGPTEKIYSRNISQAHVCIGNRALPYSDDRKYSLLILHALLGGGMSSRLFQNIREKYGVAYSIYTFADFLSDTGVFGVYIGVDKANITQTRTLIDDEFKRVKDEALSEEELDKLKSQLKGNLMLGLESTHSRMNRLAKMELYLQQYFNLDQVLDGIDKVTPQDLVSVAQEILDENTTTTMIVPK